MHSLVGDHGSVCFFRCCVVDDDDDAAVRLVPFEAARPGRAVPCRRRSPDPGLTKINRRWNSGGQDGRASAGPRAPSSRFFLVLLRAAQSDSADVGEPLPSPPLFSPVLFLSMPGHQALFFVVCQASVLQNACKLLLITCTC